MVQVGLRQVLMDIGVWGISNHVGLGIGLCWVDIGLYCSVLYWFACINSPREIQFWGALVAGIMG